MTHRTETAAHSRRCKGTQTALGVLKYSQHAADYHFGPNCRLASVSGDCKVRKAVSNIDYNMFTGKWYVVYHQADEEEDKLDCTYVNVDSPHNNSGIIYVYAYEDRKKGDVPRYAEIQNFYSTGYEVKYLDPYIWTGTMYIATIDYKRYFIGKFCSKKLNTVRVYVAFRNRNADEATLNDAKNALIDNGIAFDTLKSWNSSRCEKYPYIV